MCASVLYFKADWLMRFPYELEVIELYILQLQGSIKILQ